MSLLIPKGPHEFFDQVERLYQRGLPAGASTGWPSVDQHYTVELGQWTAVTGVPGHGKSEWTDALAVNLARQGWQFVVFSPENQPHELHTVKILEKWIGKPFGQGRTERMTQDEYIDACADLAHRFVFLTINAEFMASPSIDTVLRSAGKQIEDWRDNGSGKKCGIIIDPWNEMDHSRPSNFTETEYISQTLSLVRQFAREWSVHIWLVAHPTKLSKDKEGNYPVARLWDISGSAHWNNKADNGITVHRDVLNGGPVQIHVLKIRFKNIGKPGLVELDYDRITGRYSDRAGSTLPVSRKLLAAGEDVCPV